MHYEVTWSPTNHCMEVTVKVCDSFMNQNGLILYTIQWRNQQLSQSNSLPFSKLWTWARRTQPSAKHPQTPAPFKETEWRTKPVSFAFCFKAWSKSWQLSQTPIFFIEKFMSFVLNTRAMKIFYSHTMLRNILKTIHMACGLPSVCRPVFTWVCAEPEGQSLFQCISDGVISEEVACDFQHLLIRRQHKNKNSRF